jgi:hypothetical protein
VSAEMTCARARQSGVTGSCLVCVRQGVASACKQCMWPPTPPRLQRAAHTPQHTPQHTRAPHLNAHQLPNAVCVACLLPRQQVQVLRQHHTTHARVKRDKHAKPGRARRVRMACSQCVKRCRMACKHCSVVGRMGAACGHQRAQHIATHDTHTSHNRHKHVPLTWPAP